MKQIFHPRFSSAKRHFGGIAFSISLMLFITMLTVWAVPWPGPQETVLIPGAKVSLAATWAPGVNANICPLPTNETLPSKCPLPPKASPSYGSDSYAYEHFWWYLHDRYSYFKERQVDWNCVYQNQIANARSGKLSAAVESSLSVLKDGHVALNDVSLVVHGPFDPCRHKTKIASLYLLNGGTSCASGSLVYGTIAKNPSVGYVRVDNMELSVSTMNAAIEKLKDKSAIILDLRFNEGGEDTTALKLMGNFTNISIHSHTKEDKTAAGFVNKRNIMVTPTGMNFTGPVYVLISPVTCSAAEIGAMAANVIPNVTTIGGRSEGITSDEHTFTMQNGWSVQYSAERYSSPRCEVFERVGVPPKYDMGYSMVSQSIADRFMAFDRYLKLGLDKGSDPDIEKALELFSKM